MRKVVRSFLATSETGKVYEVLMIRSQAGIELGKGASLRVARTEYVTACGSALRCEGEDSFVLVESGERLVPFGLRPGEEET